MTDRRAFLRGAAVAIAFASSRALAQRNEKLPRLGVLTLGPSPVEAAFIQGLREAGLVDARTVLIDYRSADGDYTKLPNLAAEIVKQNPDVIASIVTAATIAVKSATPTIPIVMVGVSDPVVAGIVGNLAHPGGNITGTAVHLHDAVGKQVELIRQMLPKASRIGVLWNPANIVFQQQSLGEALIAASRLRVVAQPVGVRSREDLERALAAFASEPPDAVLALVDPVITENRAFIAETAIAKRLPVFTGFRTSTEAGILASYGPDLRVMARRAAGYVQKILKGAKPGDMAIELPTKFELVVNARTAEALGITIPAAVRARADEVIR
jgi:putative ABC transport system substrate-binding protein